MRQLDSSSPGTLPKQAMPWQWWPWAKAVVQLSASPAPPKPPQLALWLKEAA
ncbi:MAG: hypothetical protein ACUVWR_04340 [Anaerolineae bacterium]